MNKRNLPFWLFIFSLIFILIIRDLFRDGMFMDGMLYVAVAHNLAIGLGTFWHPHFSQTAMPIFHEQPPLFFGIEAVFMKIFGNSIYAERIYGLLVLLITVFLIHKLWRLVLHDRVEKNVSWLPVFLWLCIPVCFWAYSNNVEEPTMGMFDLAAVLFICRAIIQKNKIFLNLFIAAVMLIAASLCKGLQGLFPLTTIFFSWIVFKNISFSRMLANSLFLFAVVAVFYCLISLSETVRSSYQMYFHNRIVTAFSAPDSEHTDRFYIAEQFFTEFLPLFILMLAGGIFVVVKKRYSIFVKNNLKVSLWFFLIATSGTLPLMSTLVQSGFYMVTAFPYFAISFALIFAPLFTANAEQIKTDVNKLKTWTKVTWFVLFASIIFSVYTIICMPKRDKEMLHDIYLTGKIIPEGSIIGIPKELYNEWSLYTYYIRHFYISLDASPIQHKYYLSDKSFDQKNVPEGYKLLPLPTEKYYLYIKNP